MVRKLKNELVSLARTSRQHLRRAEALGKSLDQRLADKQAVAPDWIPDEDWRRDFAAVTTVIQHSGNSLMRALEGNKKDVGNLSNEQLDAQFQAEVVASAVKMSDDDWERMVRARAKKNGVT